VYNKTELIYEENFTATESVFSKPVRKFWRNLFDLTRTAPKIWCVENVQFFGPPCICLQLSGSALCYPSMPWHSVERCRLFWTTWNVTRATSQRFTSVFTDQFSRLSRALGRVCSCLCPNSYSNATRSHRSKWTRLTRLVDLLTLGVNGSTMRTV